MKKPKPRGTPLRKRRRRAGQVWPRAMMLLLGLGGAAVAVFFGFSALDPLDIRPGVAVAAAQAPGAPDGGVVPPPKPEKVKIWFFTQPVAKTELRWGKKKLGVINPTPNKPGKKPPFFIERPRDSGPMDVSARAEGYLPLNTRVYTYSDNKVWLKLTPEADKHTVLGYKQAIPDGGADGGADGGVPMGPMPPPVVAPVGPPPPPGAPAGPVPATAGPPAGAAPPAPAPP